MSSSERQYDYTCRAFCVPSVRNKDTRVDSSKDKSYSQRWTSELVSCLGSCIPRGCRLSEEVSPRLQKARLTFISLRHLWHWLIDQRSSIHCNPKAFPVIRLGNTTDDGHRLAQNIHVWTLLSLCYWWDVMKKLPMQLTGQSKGTGSRSFVNRTRLNLARLCLGHVFLVPTKHLPRFMLSSKAGSCWTMG